MAPEGMGPDRAAGRLRPRCGSLVRLAAAAPLLLGCLIVPVRAAEPEPGLEPVGPPLLACREPDTQSPLQPFEAAGYDEGLTALTFTCRDRLGQLLLSRSPRLTLASVPGMPRPLIMASSRDHSRLVIEDAEDLSVARIFDRGGALRSGSEELSVRRFQRFSPDGRSLVVLMGSELEIRDAAGRRLAGLPVPPEVSSAAESWMPALAIAPDSRSLLVAYDVDRLQLWDLSGRLRYTLRMARPDPEAYAQVRFAAFLPDGRSLVAVARHGGVSHWSIDGTLIRSFQTPPVYDAPRAVDLAPDGTLLITPEQGPIALWSLEGRRLRELSDASVDQTVQHVRFSRDGATIQVETIDELQFWSRDGVVQRRIPTSLGVSLDSLSPDGRWLVSASPRPQVMLQLWRLIDLPPRAIPPGRAP